MITKLKKLSILMLFVIMIFSMFSCEDEAKAVMTLLNGVEKDGIHSISVSSDVESIDLNDYITIPEDAKWELYSDEELDEEIESSVVSLNTGVNQFYVKVKEGATKKSYTIQVIRKKSIIVSFDANGGSACQEVIVDEGTIITTPTTTRAGYIFVGWDVDFTVPVTDNVTAKAIWEAKSFKLVVDGDEKSVKFGEDYSLTAKDKLGYKFVKWVDSKNQEFSATGKWDSLEDVSVTSVYAKENYKITFVFNADIANKVSSYTVEDIVTFETPVHPNGLEFDGWYSEPELKNKVTEIKKGTTGNKTLYAKWNVVVVPEEPEYTLTIDADGFSFDGQVITVKYGESYVLPIVPERTGYEFVAWVNGTSVVPTSGIWDIRDNATLTIRWNPIKFNITYVIDSKTTNTNTVTEFTVQDTVELLEPTRPNASFVGWFTSSDFKEETRVDEIVAGTSEDVVLYAKFNITTYTLTYDAKGGTISKDSFTYELGDSYTLLTPEYPGYTFDGWYNGDVKISDGEWTFEENITLVAKWTRVLYLVEYELSGGATTETLKQSYSIEDTFTLPIPTKSGYFFLGWSEAETGNIYQTMTIQKGTTGNKKFVANWSEFSFSFSGTEATVTGYKNISSRAFVKIPTSVNYNGVTYTVTEIGPNVFSGIGPLIKSGYFVINGNVVRKFDVDVPKTLKKIGANAFYNCNDVCINVALDSGVDLYEWADSIIVAEGNDHVIDVIKGRRPAIGWSIYG